MFVSCSFCVRSSFGRVLCGVRLVLVRVAFVRGGLSTGQRRTSDRRRTGGHSSDADILRHSKMGGGGLDPDGTRAAHGLAYGLLTDGRRAGFGQTWTNPDVPRWAAARWRTTHGRETDTPRAYHGRFPYGRETDGTRACLRASDGRATGLSWTIPLRTGDGLSTDGRRTGGVKDNALPHQSYT